MFLKEESNVSRGILKNLNESEDNEWSDAEINRIQEVLDSHKDDIQKYITSWFNETYGDSDIKEKRELKSIEVYKTKYVPSRFSVYLDIDEPIFTDEGWEYADYLERIISNEVIDVYCAGVMGSDYEFETKAGVEHESSSSNS